MNLVGLNALFRARNKQKIRLFALHGVGSYSGAHSWVPIRPQHDVGELEQILKELCRHYRFISIGEATEIISGRSRPVDNAAVLTFDDGYLNNFTQALPVLRKFNVPGVFYVASGLVETRQPYWFDRLDFVLQVAAKQGVSVELAGRTFAFYETDRAAIEKTFAELRAHCKKNFPDDRLFAAAMSDVAASLEASTGVSLAAVLEGDEWACVVSAQDIGRYAEDGLVTFGGHTVSHLRLSCSSQEDVARELQESKQKIEEWSGRPCVDFSYPNGDYDDASIAAVKFAGYRSAVTSDAGMSSSGDDVLAISRLSLPVSFSLAELRARASGLEEAATRLVSRIRHK